MGLSSRYSLPYPEPTDSVDVVRDMKALAQKTDDSIWAEATYERGKAATAVRTSLATYGPGVWSDVSAPIVGYAFLAGRQYLINGVGIGYIGGATASITTRVRAGGAFSTQMAQSSAAIGFVQLLAGTWLYVPPSNLTADVSFQVYVDAPATGFVVGQGSAVTLAMVG
jgi:hypothetical protein